MIRFGLIAAALTVVAAPAMAQHPRSPAVHHDAHDRGHAVRKHRRQVCTVKWVHHRNVRRCAWR